MTTESLPPSGLPSLRRDCGLVRLGLALLLLGAPSLGAASSRETPVAVSPGGEDEILGTASSCPTFSWGGVADARTYELAVFELDASDDRPVLRAEIPGTASSWTPPSDDCLAPGLYLWSIRLRDDPTAEWARGRSFEVRVAPSDEEVAQAIETLERYRASANAADRPTRSRTAGATGTAATRLNQSPRSSVMPADAEGTGAAAAITGEQGATSGEAYGVVGTSASPLGAGVYAANSAPDAYDLVLDGSSDGASDLFLSSRELTYFSDLDETLHIRNGGTGSVTLDVWGTVLGIFEGTFVGNGVGLYNVPTDAHTHDAADIETGTFPEWMIAAALARDAEIVPAVLAGDGSGSTLDADLLDGTDGASFQVRVTGVCPVGQAMQGVNADGSVVCYQVPVPPRITTVDDPANAVGWYTSLAIGADGLPVISYYDWTAGSLKVAKCNDAACAGGGETITTVDDPANSVGWSTSLAIGADGLPVISYFDDTADSLKVAKCNDAACAGGDETITTVDDPANQVGLYTSLAIGADGLPVISYYDDTAKSLKVAKCNDAACAGGGETITTVDDPANSVGWSTSLAIGADGLPVISYYDDTAKSLKVAKCNDAACAGGDETITTVDDPANSVGWFTSLAIGADGLPVISYFDNTAYSLKVAKCNDAACAGGDETITTVDDPANQVGLYTSLAIGADGLPVTSYFDNAASSLKVAKCRNASCRG